MYEPPTEPPEPIDFEGMREEAFDLIMSDSLQVQDMIWDLLLDWSDDDILNFFDDYKMRWGRDEQERY